MLPETNTDDLFDVVAAFMRERLDWLWFLDYTIESPIPDHSVLSKA